MRLAAWILTSILLGCGASTSVDAPSPDSALDVEIAAGPNPWTHLGLQNQPGNFTFAIVSDLTGGYRDGVFPAAVKRLNLLRPEFVMSVGDLIEGYTDDREQLAREWDQFDAMLEPLAAPFFYTAGNHDYSNEVMAALWKERIGRSYYHFVYRDVLFLVLNSEETQRPNAPEIQEMLARIDAFRETDPEAAAAAAAKLVAGIDWNGTMPGQLSDEQIAYFKRVIADNTDVRWTFLFMHQPLWQGDGNRGLEEIETALGDRSCTVFAGHVHNYTRFEVGGRVHIRLGTTGGEWVVPGTTGNFDHVIQVTMTDEGPSIANLLLEGILDEYGRISEDRIWRARED